MVNKNDTTMVEMTRQEAAVTKFSSFLSFKGAVNEDFSLFSEAAEENDVVLVLPTLDVKLPEACSTSNSGATRASSMPLIVEDHIVSATAVSSFTESLNSVSDFNRKTNNRTTLWTRSTARFAAQAIASSASNCFKNLIASKLKSWTVMLLKHSLSEGNAESRSQLLSMLTASIQVKNATTLFRPLQLPGSSKAKIKEADMVLPLLFEVNLFLSVDNKEEVVTIRTPGTIAVDIDEAFALVKSIVRLDTNTFFTSMSDKASVVVFKAVAHATKSALPSSCCVAPTQHNEATNTVTKAHEATASLSLSPVGASTANVSLSSQIACCGSTSDLSSSTAPSSRNLPSPTLQKAPTSALRLSGILNGKSADGNTSKDSLLGVRRNRSVKWDTPLELPVLGDDDGPARKKPCLSKDQIIANLKSFKSFGRPHAGVFTSNGPRNATFGEYSRAHLWGRDGRMASHPVPSSVVPNRNGSIDRLMLRSAVSSSGAKTNAVFDLAGLRSKQVAASHALPQSAATMLEKVMAGSF